MYAMHATTYRHPGLCIIFVTCSIVFASTLAGVMSICLPHIRDGTKISIGNTMPLLCRR